MKYEPLKIRYEVRECAFSTSENGTVYPVVRTYLCDTEAEARQIMGNCHFAHYILRAVSNEVYIPSAYAVHESNRLKKIFEATDKKETT